MPYKYSLTNSSATPTNESSATPSLSRNNHELTNKIIDIILSSPLNIEAIPDDVERNLYQEIFNELESHSAICSSVCTLSRIINVCCNADDISNNRTN